MNDNDLIPVASPPTNALLVGFYSAIATAVVTVVTFGLAMTAVPISGANCIDDCARYPYLDTVSQYPRDYRWMFVALVLMLLYVVLMSSIYTCASEGRKILGQLGLSFAIMGAVVLASAYYVQLSVVPASLMSGETEGIALLTQYNPHGLFIALEEFGYIVIAISYAFLAFVSNNRGRLESAIRWTFLLGFLGALVALAAMTTFYGQERLDRLEVALISIDWLVLIVGSILLAVNFRRQIRTSRT